MYTQVADPNLELFCLSRGLGEFNQYDWFSGGLELLHRVKVEETFDRHRVYSTVFLLPGRYNIIYQYTIRYRIDDGEKFVFSADI